MKNVSNQLILTLLGLAVALSVVSTIITVTQLSSLGGTYNLLSGAATSTGTGETNLTITATTSLTNQNFQVNFGSGRVNQTCAFCTMNSDSGVVWHFANGSNVTGTAGVGCCVSFSAVASGFLLENTGNVNVSLGYTCSGNCTHLTFISGNRAPGMAGLGIKAAANSQSGQTGEDGGLDTLASCAGGGTSFRDSGFNITNATSYENATNTGADLGNFAHAFRGVPSNVSTALTRVGHWLCGNSSSYPLASDNARDAAVVDINVSIPADAIATGSGSAFTLTFNATSAG